MNVNKIREDFPILDREVNGHRLVYFDNAATTQKPVQVINTIKEYYERYNANIHRGIHTLSEEATQMYEDSKRKVGKFINAKFEEVIYTRNASESLNLVANILRDRVRGKKVVISMMEHHSNIIPWQLMQPEIKLEYVGMKNWQIDLDELAEKSDGAAVVSVVHASNVLGSINDVKEIGKIAHDAGAYFVVDAAQSAPHMKIDVRKIGADFLAFSGHKMLGPTGIGVLYGRRDLLEELPPYMGGGDMIKTVSKYSAEWNDLPWKYEAGTPNIAGGIGLGAAVDYLMDIGMDNVEKYEHELSKYLLDQLSEVADTVLGPEQRTALAAFVLNGVHPHDLAGYLNEFGIAIRSGLHCAHPLHEELGLNATARASLYIYNTKEEVDFFIEKLQEAKTILG